MRALLLVLDSVGIGNAPDAEQYGDGGANTLGHIRQRTPGLALPNLSSLGLPELTDGFVRRERYSGSYGRMRERSAGKDTTTGHWELAGAVLEKPFATFERFPEALLTPIEREAGIQFVGNCAASGTAIIEELGAEHLRTGNPIVYTSADSVLQIAAHEERFGLERLYQLCRIARRHADAYRIGRVIARPFVGSPGTFTRTKHRHDYSIEPPRTVLDALFERDVATAGVGKIHDIFAGKGIRDSLPTGSNAEGMAVIDRLWNESRSGLIFANLVDFDMIFGHRRNVAGYANALGDFDRWLGGFVPRVRPEDLVIITADHGNDPTFRGTDHTREEVPLFVLHRGQSRALGRRESFADVAASVAELFEVPWPNSGSSFLTSECTSRP